MSPSHVERGLLERAGAALPFLLGVPADAGAATPILVCVHGVRRNVQAHFDAFRPLAAAARSLLVAPSFEASRFPGYQRLGQGALRADLALIDLLTLLAERFGSARPKAYFFGHSGGAQFVHRFAMVHPTRVARYAVSAAGWYTMPDPALTYPLGTHAGPMDPGALDAFLRIPGLVFVGERDRNPGPMFRSDAELNLAQGHSRIERATRWECAVNRRALDSGLAPPLALCRIEGCAHGFAGLIRRGALHEKALEFLAPGRVDEA